MESRGRFSRGHASEFHRFRSARITGQLPLRPPLRCPVGTDRLVHDRFFGQGRCPLKNHRHVVEGIIYSYRAAFPGAVHELFSSWKTVWNRQRSYPTDGT